MEIALKSVSIPRQQAAQVHSSDWTFGEKAFVIGFVIFVVALVGLAVYSDPSALMEAASSAANVL